MQRMKRQNETNQVKRVPALLAVVLLLWALTGCSVFPFAPGIAVGTAAPDTQTGKTQSEGEPQAPLRTFQLDPDHGSAVRMEGTTLLVSIFASDRDTSWDFESEQDQKVIQTTLNNLKVASAYLSEQTQRYGKELSFLYDWREAEDLAYTAEFDDSMVRQDTEKADLQIVWLCNHIDLSALAEKYQADNVLFLFFFNTDTSSITDGANSELRSWCMPHRHENDCLLELCNIYVNSYLRAMSPADYAHEILHAFGAKDLYFADEGITQDYVNSLHFSKDIMYSTNRNSDRITSELSDLDAYYVGIAPRPAVADKWGLGLSEFDAD